MSNSESGVVAKRCVICGADCAGEPRIKDPKGRYYHQSCHEQAEAERAGQSRRGVAELAGDGPPIDLLAAAAAESAADASSWLDDLPVGGSSGSSPSACSGCGMPLVAGAIVCTSCGHQVGGGTLKTKKRRAARASGGSRFSIDGAGWLPMLAVPVGLGVLTAVVAVAIGLDAAWVPMLLLAAIGLVAGIWTLVDAWARSVLIFLGVLLGNVFLAGIPAVIYVLFFAQDPRLKGLYVGSFIGVTIAFVGLGVAAAAEGVDLFELSGSSDSFGSFDTEFSQPPARR